MKVALVAIAKDEAKSLPEWIAHHLYLGFDDIIVYDNESTDNSEKILEKLGEALPVTRNPWNNREIRSPQLTAYNHFRLLHASQYDWVAFFDLDEFLVVRNGASLKTVLSQYPDSVAAVGVNWLTLGSSGQAGSDYERVTETFRWGPKRSFRNNAHIKTIMRPPKVKRVDIHHCDVISGDYIHPNGEPLEFPSKPGITQKIEHSVLQLNHYQVKSLEEFEAKIKKGLATRRADDPKRVRERPRVLLEKLDRQEEFYNDVDASLFESDVFKKVASLLSDI
ncbi:glycosyltransferase family 2 protein [Kushneria aurantia]|uniref:Glycosyltransferase family 2 protein n=1 Tax=Kushneria aurantia TaxID=504092 RepID=A0ABV6FYV4_9GAMM|nr:glycosyltransferase family 2 protein [Kushneria aurantia]